MALVKLFDLEVYFICIEHNLYNVVRRNMSIEHRYYHV
jgi:hypothetical protein